MYNALRFLRGASGGECVAPEDEEKCIITSTRHAVAPYVLRRYAFTYEQQKKLLR